MASLSPESPSLTLPQAADYLAISTRTVRRLLASGHVAGRKQELAPGRFRWLIERDELDRANAAGKVVARPAQPDRGSLKQPAAPALVPEVASLREHLARAEGEAQRLGAEVGWLRDALREAGDRERWLRTLALPAARSQPEEAPGRMAGVRWWLWLVAVLAVGGAAAAWAWALWPW